MSLLQNNCSNSKNYNNIKRIRINKYQHLIPVNNSMHCHSQPHTPFPIHDTVATSFMLSPLSSLLPPLPSSHVYFGYIINITHAREVLKVMPHPGINHSALLHVALGIDAPAPCSPVCSLSLTSIAVFTMIKNNTWTWTNDESINNLNPLRHTFYETMYCRNWYWKIKCWNSFKFSANQKSGCCLHQ